MYYLLAIPIIFIVAYVIIKLTMNTKENPDSKLSVWEHPSTFKKQNIEMVDNALKSQEQNFTKDDMLEKDGQKNH